VESDRVVSGDGIIGIQPLRSGELNTDRGLHSVCPYALNLETPGDLLRNLLGRHAALEPENPGLVTTTLCQTHRTAEMGQQSRIREQSEHAARVAKNVKSVRHAVSDR
jgi:hypothetical protein